MPYTLCHPVIGLPFRKKAGIFFTAFVLGSMAPDFEYFYLFFTSGYSHSIEGLFTRAWPAGWLLLLMWNHLWIPALGYFCNDSPFRKVPHSSLFSFIKTNFLILIGAGTHILWDGFTHSSVITTGLFPLLSKDILFSSGKGIPIYQVLQHSSSLAGGLLLVFFYCRWQKKPNEWNLVFTVLYCLISVPSVLVITCALYFRGVHSNVVVVCGLGLMMHLFLSLSALGVYQRLKASNRTL